jgi:hypothetical protein
MLTRGAVGAALIDAGGGATITGAAATWVDGIGAEVIGAEVIGAGVMLLFAAPCAA